MTIVTLESLTILGKIYRCNKPGSRGRYYQCRYGTYFENIDFMDKNISVLGEDMHTTIIDGGGLDVVVKIENGSYPRFENFTVTNGYNSENM